MVTIAIPIFILELFSTFFIDNQITRSIVIKPTDNIKKRSFTGTRRAKNCRKFRDRKIDINIIKDGALNTTSLVDFRHTP